jgi:murein DD-endopeptidase MepM/ murein hydrolase activator NlpD
MPLTKKRSRKLFLTAGSEERALGLWVRWSTSGSLLPFSAPLIESALGGVWPESDVFLSSSMCCKSVIVLDAETIESERGTNLSSVSGASNAGVPGRGVDVAVASGEREVMAVGGAVVWWRCRWLSCR